MPWLNLTASYQSAGLVSQLSEFTVVTKSAIRAIKRVSPIQRRKTPKRYDSIDNYNAYGVANLRFVGELGSANSLPYVPFQNTSLWENFTGRTQYMYVSALFHLLLGVGGGRGLYLTNHPDPYPSPQTLKPE